MVWYSRDNPNKQQKVILISAFPPRLVNTSVWLSWAKWLSHLIFHRFVFLRFFLCLFLKREKKNLFYKWYHVPQMSCEDLICEKCLLDAECKQGGKKERDQVLFITYIQVFWAKYCDYLSPLAVHGLTLASLNWAPTLLLNRNLMTFVYLSKTLFLGCLITPQDSPAVANTRQDLLFATEVKHMAQPMPRAACLPLKSCLGMMLAVMVPASFLGIGWES